MSENDQRKRKKRYSKQQLLKLQHKSCHFCGESDYNLLDTHRIVEGGVYHERNCVVCCSLCHRKVHSGRICVLGKHPCTGKKLFCVHYVEDGVEKWK